MQCFAHQNEFGICKSCGKGVCRSPPIAALHRTPLHAALAAVLLFGAMPATTIAASIAVTSPDDTVHAGTCTLRQAILSMNTGAVTGTSCVNSGGAFGNGDTITFAKSGITGGTAAGTITLADSADTTGSTGGMLVITDTQLTVDGSAWLGSGSGSGLYSGGVTIARPALATNAFRIMRDSAPKGASLVLNGLTIHNGAAAASDCNARAQGGGICVANADLTLINSTVSGNQATNGGGLAVYSATVTNSTLSGNQATMAGGGIYNQSSLTLTNTLLSGNGAAYGGGIATLYGNIALISSTLSDNSATYGGGVLSQGYAMLTHSTLSGNSATHGGGIFHVGAVAHAALIVANSTLNNNSASNGGGGIENDYGTVTLTNSTLSGNSAAYDGGVYSKSGLLTIVNSTLVGDTATQNGSGISAKNGTLTLTNSIIAEGCSGEAFDGGGNIDTGTSCQLIATTSRSNVTGTQLNLGPLQDNGGPTQTMLPGTGSVAINSTTCAKGPLTDERGMIRPDPASIGTSVTPCDIGAVEANSIPDAIFADGFGT
jgi:hypothetical protein